MNNAKHYLKADVFSRLNGGGGAGGNGGNEENINNNDNNGEEGRSVMDMETFMTNVQSGSNSNNQQTPKQRRPLSAGRSRPNSKSSSQQRHQQRPSSADRQRPSSTNNTPSKSGNGADPNSKMFHSFLARQNHAEMMKQKHLETMTRAQDTVHEPELCDTTKAMTEGRQTSDFLKRMKQYQVRKEHQEIR